MIRVTDQYFWNFIFAMFFVVLVVMGAIILDTESRIPLAELSLTDYLLITLASWRLTRLFVYDSITKWIREQFWDAKKTSKGYQLEKPPTGPRRTLADLFACPWCMGIWTATIIAFLYLLTPYMLFPVILLSVSAVSTFLQLLANLVGYRAVESKPGNDD